MWALKRLSWLCDTFVTFVVVVEEGDGAFFLLLAFCYLFGVVVDGRMERVRITKGIELQRRRLHLFSIRHRHWHIDSSNPTCLSPAVDAGVSSFFIFFFLTFFWKMAKACSIPLKIPPLPTSLLFSLSQSVSLSVCLAVYLLRLLRIYFSLSF